MGFIDSILGPLVGHKPNVPDLTLPNISQTQLDTAKGNLSVLPSAQQLGTGVDQYNLQQLQKALEFLQPGGLAKYQANTNAELSGVLNPEDTQALIRGSTAAGYGKGFNFGAGGIGRNLVLRDLGLGVEQQRQRGMADFLNLGKIAPKPFDVTSMFFTPQQRFQNATAQAEESFNHDWLKAQIAAAPSPLGQFIQNVVYAVAGTAGRYFGVANGGGKPANSASAGGSGGESDFYTN